MGINGLNLFFLGFLTRYEALFISPVRAESLGAAIRAYVLYFFLAFTYFALCRVARRFVSAGRVVFLALLAYPVVCVRRRMGFPNNTSFMHIMRLGLKFRPISVSHDNTNNLYKYDKERAKVVKIQTKMDDGDAEPINWLLSGICCCGIHRPLYFFHLKE